MGSLFDIEIEELLNEKAPAERIYEILVGNPEVVRIFGTIDPDCVKVIIKMIADLKLLHFYTTTWKKLFKEEPSLKKELSIDIDEQEEMMVKLIENTRELFIKAYKLALES